VRALTLDVPIAAHHAHHRIVGLGSRIGEKDMIEMSRRHLRQQLGQVHCRRMCGLEEIVVIRQLLHLLIGCTGEFFAAVADIDAPQTSHGVENAPAVGIPYINAFSTGNDAAAFAVQGLRIGEGMQMVKAIQLLPLLGVEISSVLRHGHTFSSRNSLSHELITLW
jgi:hypothetical protein